MKLTWIKKIIIYIDNKLWGMYIPIWKVSRKIFKNEKTKKVLKEVNKYELVIFICKVIILLIIINKNYDIRLESSIIFGMKLMIIILILRIIVKQILYRNGWDGKVPVVKLEKLEKYFKEKEKLRNILIIVYKYGNIWRWVLLIRNKIAYGLRYIRYMLYKVNVLKHWGKVEGKMYYIINNIIVEYIRVVIEEVYIPIKKRILLGDLLSIVEGRLIIIVIIIIFKSIPFILKYILIWKLMEVIYKIIIYDFCGKRQIHINIFWRTEKGNLSAKLYRESYILKNLNIKNQYGYNPWYVGVESDRFYKTKQTFQRDIYKGLWLKDVTDFDSMVHTYTSTYLIFEYALTQKELKHHWKRCEESLEEFKEISKVINEVTKLIESSSKMHKLACIYYYECADLHIEIGYTKFVYKEELEIELNNKVYREKIDQKLYELSNFGYLVKKYRNTKDKCNDFKYEIYDYRDEQLEKKKVSEEDDEEIYEKIRDKYNLFYNKEKS